jgi:heme/copper-type cytochrome/quinol oxidase subunit 1
MTTIDTHKTATAPSDAGRTLATLGAWLTTTDHKKLGRMYIAVALAALVAVGVLGAILGIERADTESALLDSGLLQQFFSAYRVGLTFGVLVPLMVGIALAVVPLQVGARSVAFPRLASAGFWMWAVGLDLVILSIALNGGPGGGEARMVGIFLSAHIMLVLGLLATAVSIATTILTTRAPGMNMRRVPLFSFSVLVSMLGLLIALPVLVGTLIYNYVDYRYGRVGFGGNKAILNWVGFAFTQPLTIVYALPVFGFAAETIAVASRKRMPMRGIVFTGLGLLGVASFGGVIQAAAGVRRDVVDTSLSTALTDILPYALFNLLPLLGAFVVLSVGGLALGSGRPRITAPFLFGFFGAGLVFVGILANALYHIGDAQLAGTVFEEAAWLYVAYGSVLAALGTIAYWGPKLTGRIMPMKQTIPLALLGALGVVLSSLPFVVAGFAKQPAGSVEFDYDGPQNLWNILSAAGHALMVLTVLAFVGLALRSFTKGEFAGDDPFDAHTLEWATVSPAPEANFAEVQVVMSAEPLLDLKPATAGSPV